MSKKMCRPWLESWQNGLLNTCCALFIGALIWGVAVGFVWWIVRDGGKLRCDIPYREVARATTVAELSTRLRDYDRALNGVSGSGVAAMQHQINNLVTEMPRREPESLEEWRGFAQALVASRQLAPPSELGIGGWPWSESPVYTRGVLITTGGFLVSLLLAITCSLLHKYWLKEVEDPTSGLPGATN